VRVLPLLVAAICCSVCTVSAFSQTPRLIPIGEGYAGSSINVVANRRNALFTHESFQFAAFYDADGYMVLARRKIDLEKWELRRTAFRGHVADAHNSISLAVDGAGFLHVAWDHHGQPLNYARSVKPLSIELGPKQRMNGDAEQRVTYPELYLQPSGDLLCLYRDGESGNGQLVLKRYRTGDQSWQTIQTHLIDGEGLRSAYWGAASDRAGGLHLAWIWRETPDVASNHDIAYAYSPDGGVTWQAADGRPLNVPMTEAKSDYAARIPRHSNLMNSPVVAVDQRGRPYITTYWSDQPGAPPQFHLIQRAGASWQIDTISKLQNAFKLEGTATKRPPISRAALFVDGSEPKASVHLVFRDDARGGRAVLLSTPAVDSGTWRARELTQQSLGAWEPVFDPTQWVRTRQIHLLWQPVQQADGDDANGVLTASTPVGVLIVTPK